MVTMFNTGPWRLIVFILITFSTSGYWFTRCKTLILDYNLMFGYYNTFYKFEDKLPIMDYIKHETYLPMVTPLIAGLLIDKTRLIWLWMLLFGLVPMLSKMIPILHGDSNWTWFITEVELNALGYSALQVCQIVMLSKWFKG